MMEEVKQQWYICFSPRCLINDVFAKDSRSPPWSRLNWVELLFVPASYFDANATAVLNWPTWPPGLFEQVYSLKSRRDFNVVLIFLSKQNLTLTYTLYASGIFLHSHLNLVVLYSFCDLGSLGLVLSINKVKSQHSKSQTLKAFQI